MAEPRHGSSEPRGQSVVARKREAEGRFGLMFKHLKPFTSPSPALLAKLAETMRQTAPEDNPDIPAGFTFFGQFVDHDLTADRTSELDKIQDPDGLKNFRTPIYDLDSVYAGGPSEKPDLYDGAKMRLSTSNGFTDLLRDADGIAKIGDPRNEENLIIAQLQIAFIHFHNRMVDHVQATTGASGDQLFKQAQRLSQFHYQWVVLTDFLPRICGQDVVDSVFKKPSGNAPVRADLRFYKPKKTPFIPVEWSVAAYRFGHSQIRAGYRMNVNRGAAFFQPQPGEGNLNGFRPIPPDLKVDWRFFYDIPGSTETPQRSQRIDAKITLPLFELPFGDPPKSLAERNLLRGRALGLPSGQAVAEEMGIAPLDNQTLGIAPDPEWENQAPLWFYILKEAELLKEGRSLGPVGGRIVAETLVGMLAANKSSFFTLDRNFQPQAPIAPAPGQFRMGDLLKFAQAA